MKAVVAALAGYVFGWWWRGFVDRWLNERERRITEGLAVVDEMVPHKIYVYGEPRSLPR